MSSGTELPIACSLSADQMRARGVEARQLLGRALVRRERTSGGFLLRFHGRPEIDASVRDLARREKECCPFLEFSFAHRDGELELRVTAPPEAQDLLEAIFGHAR